MLKKIAVTIVVLLAALLLFATTRPDTFQVARSVRIAAPPEKIFPYLEDFHHWGAWSPWEKMDPAMTRTYSGAASGPGAVYAWAGNSDVGTGRMEITETVPPSKVMIALDFLSPFETHNTAEFLLGATGDSTTVTWTMRGPNLYIGKVMGIFVSMDRMIGKDFEAGLVNLKSVAEH
jgi:uncharacterized protein YndB with AHSA1/START domain